MVGIVILNYNNWKDTEACLQSIKSANISMTYKVYVVDNASVVPIPQELEEYISQHSEIVYMQSNKNTGYSAGNNLGIRAALSDQCEFVVISNNDILFNPDVIETLHDYLIKKPNVGIVAPMIRLYSGELQEINLGCKMTVAGKYKFFFRKTPLGFLSKKFVSQFQLNPNNIKEPTKVFAVSGCFFMISSKCLEKIGLFDENVFLYDEEYILGSKMEEAGLQTILLSNIEVIHKHGQSTKSNKAFSYICLIESEMYYFKKYVGATMFKLCAYYFIRSCQYYLKCITNDDYRKNAKSYQRKTWKAFSKKYQ